MAEIRVSGHTLHLNVRDELERYDFDKPKWSEDKLIACSPFRDDRSPSFFITLEGEYAGTWGDSGAYGTEYASGNLPKLLSIMNGTTYEEEANYLIESYSIGRTNVTNGLVTVKIPTINVKNPYEYKRTINPPFVQQSLEYGRLRGISNSVQEEFKVGVNTKLDGFIGLPWLDEHTGEILAIKYRSFKGKEMFYEKDGQRLNTLVYGLHRISSDYVIICEGEFDAMSFVEVGYDAVAVGTANISKEQVDKILYKGVKTIYLAGDNDRQGRKFNRQMYNVFKKVKLKHIDYEDFKDANEVLCDLGKQELRKYVELAMPINRIKIKER